MISWGFVANADAIEEMVKFESMVNVTQQLQKGVQGFRTDQDHSGYCSWLAALLQTCFWRIGVDRRWK